MNPLSLIIFAWIILIIDFKIGKMAEVGSEELSKNNQRIYNVQVSRDKRLMQLAYNGTSLPHYRFYFIIKTKIEARGYLAVM